MYEIGEKTYHNGNEITITSAPYTLYGGTWQDGTNEAGKTVTVRAKSEVVARVAEHQAAYAKQQAEFARLAQLEATNAR